MNKLAWLLLPAIAILVVSISVAVREQADDGYWRE